MDRKKRLFNRVLIVSGLSAGLAFAIYVWAMNRTPKHYYIPEGYSGWVTIKYEKPDAPALPVEDGTQILRIPRSGILETSSELDEGWSRDEHYWYGPNGESLIPKNIENGTEPLRWIHDNEETNMDLSQIILDMPEIADTTLWEGTRIDKRGDKVDVRTGRKVIQQFFVSPEPKPYFYTHDSLPPERKIW